MAKERTDSEKRAFKLLTICNFINAQVPMVLDYAEHNKVSDTIAAMTNKLGSVQDTSNVSSSPEWFAIRKILDI